KMRNYALFSVNIIEDIEWFGKVLNERGCSLIATEKPLTRLRAAGIQAISVEEFTGVSGSYPFPPTLHPKIELALTTDAEEKIHLLYDIPYGLDEGNDVGGHTLLALAAKGGRIPVCTLEDMRAVVRAIEERGEVPAEEVRRLTLKANLEVMKHYGEVIQSAGGDVCTLIGSRVYELAGGENPYQVPAHLLTFRSDDPLSLDRFELLGEEPPCFTNLADLDATLETLCKLALALRDLFGRAPFLTVAAKHGNPCGIGVDWESRDGSLEKALWGNPLALWGGEVIVNFALGTDEARILTHSERREKLLGSGKWMLDVIAAPGYEGEASALLGRRKFRKVLLNPALEFSELRRESRAFRQVRGGLLCQPPADYILNLNGVHWTRRAAEADLEAMIIAWAAAFTSNLGGNEVALAKKGRLLAVGGGPSTVDAAETALNRANKYESASGAVFCADAFFPFKDAPELLVKAGCTGGLVPDGGLRRREVFEFFAAHGKAVGFIPEEYRGFCRH
ncbi:MAG: hypothetical protein ACE5LX_09195, partial [Nitrospinota bacterium]